MKSIGVVTFHRANSFGATLQAYATVAFLNESGYKAEIVDYTNEYEQRFQKLFYTENGKLSGYITASIKNLLFRKRYYTKKSFGHLERYYPISSVHYKDKKSLETAKYDILIAGSDQIWNPVITNKIDTTYLLQFGTADKRISVASSMGSHILSDVEKEIFQRALATFSAISIREEFGKNQLTELVDKPIQILMDPTFLVRKKDWLDKLGKNSKYYSLKEKYILTFFVAPDGSYRERVQAYADYLHLPVWSIQSTTMKRTNCQRSILGATIEDFIALIAGAELVITDSFHGVALSLNLQRDFIAFKNTANPVRVVSILDKLEIPERLNMIPKKYHPVNYKRVNQIMDPLCEESRQWVIKAIEG